MTTVHATFADLPVGQTFRFASELNREWLSIVHGPWRKLTRRQYAHLDTGGVYTVGTTRVEVFFTLEHPPCEPAPTAATR